MKKYKPSENRYQEMQYRRCGKSGIDLPLLSLGLWHNFGDHADFDNAAKLLRTAFDHGITHFDLANNYGPPYGTAEKNFGKIFKRDFKKYRDELIISTKAGYDMWPGALWKLGIPKVFDI
ncbi:aldo/keto reductase [Galbibacter sp. BG1]|uniref:aldo/keto reductase n=1 Tax=Galbibacter sp. BG1 TaxID=1170699 RepID=UPI0021051BBE|nr:aldo/keto reductase [Galbibacter sp. BG1]